MTTTLAITSRIDAELNRLRGEIESELKGKWGLGLKKEALGNILLLLAMSDERLVRQAVNIIRIWGIGGAEEMEKRGL